MYCFPGISDSLSLACFFSPLVGISLAVLHKALSLRKDHCHYLSVVFFQFCFLFSSWSKHLTTTFDSPLFALVINIHKYVHIHIPVCTYMCVCMYMSIHTHIYIYILNLVIIYLSKTKV